MAFAKMSVIILIALLPFCLKCILFYEAVKIFESPGKAGEIHQILRTIFSLFECLT